MNPTTSTIEIGKVRIMKKNTRKRYHSNGMTVIEVVVAIAILAMVSITLLAMYSMSLRFIMKAGVNSDKQYQTVGTLENKLVNNLDPDTVPETIDTTPVTNVTVSINFDGTPVSATGTIEKIDFQDDEYEMTVSVFVPDED